jgi:hypothetical protein
MSSNFRDVDRNSRYLFPESIDEWLPEDHLARFVVEIVGSLDIANIERAYSGGGIAPYHPRMLVCLNRSTTFSDERRDLCYSSVPKYLPNILTSQTVYAIACVSILFM